MSQISANFFGPFRVLRAGKSITGFESDKMRALLAYLVVEADRPHRREALAALLWPEQSDEAARQSLRQALYVLRRTLSGDSSEENGLLQVTRQTVQLNPSGDIESDIRRFNELLAACKAHRHQSPDSQDASHCAECIERLQHATELYKGDFLQGFVVHDCREFEEWMLLEREVLHRQMMQSLERLADYYEDAGEHEQSLRFALGQLQLEPWREEAHRQAMRLLSRTGQRSIALAQYETCRQALAEELGIEPARETTALYERIRDAEAETQPEPPSAGKRSLPVASTQLIGREAEVTSIVERLLREDVRLLTVTGPGGVGKTRVALQAGYDLQDHFADGAYFVSLAPITDPGLVLSAISSVLAVKEMPDKSILDSIISYLQKKQVLLILDNFEQVGEAAFYVSQMLASCQGLKVLVTSRVPLNVRGEKEYLVPPLSVPDMRQLPPLDRLRHYEAVRLFIERATDVKPNFEVTDANARAVVEICAKLDGLPLAIELAAARVRTLSPEALASRLSQRLKTLTGGARDLPARQQTLRNTIDWSYNLLDSSERTLFRRISAFQGGRTLEAIQAVCSGVGILAPIRLEVDQLDGVESLLSKSLLRQIERHDAEPRFWMLETIHEYAREKLAESGEEDEVRRRHARYFLAIVEQAAPHLKKEDQVRWLEQLEDENDNIRAAFRWARECGEAGDGEAAEIGLRLVIALERFWEVRVYLREGLEQALGVLAIGNPCGAIRARALKVAAALADVCGEYDKAHAILDESMQIWQELGDRKSLVETLHALGSLHYSQGDIAKARFYFEESLRTEEEASNRKTSLHSLGLIFFEQGDYVTATSLIEEAMERERGLGDTRRVALALANLGLVAYEQGDYALALSRQRESLAIRQALGAKLGIAYSLEGLAMSYRGIGSTEKAARLWGASQAMRDAIGAPLPPKEYSKYRQEMDMVRVELGEEGFQRAYAEGRSMSIDQAVSSVLEED